ncbi:MAG: hypothetical protein ACTSUE_03390 [Promethearchaeota archaeon]
MSNWFTEFLSFWGRHSAWLLIPAASIIFTWVLEAKKRKDLGKEEWERETNVSKLVKIFAYIGMVYGVLLMIGAVSMELYGNSPSWWFRQRWGEEILPGEPEEIVNHFTAIMYFIAGMVMFFKPLKDIPFASLIALATAAGVTLLCAYYIPATTAGSALVEYVIELKWLLIIIFVVVLSITFAVSKVSFNLMTKFSKVISMPPFAVIFASILLIQAIMLLLGFSIVMW